MITYSPAKINNYFIRSTKHPEYASLKFS